MAYSLSRLTSRAEADALLGFAQEDKDTLAFRLTTFERQLKNSQNKATDIEADLAQNQAEIIAADAAIAALPDGTAKEAARSRKRKLEGLRAVINERKFDFGIVALIDNELDMARVQKELEEVNAFIAQVTTRKAELPA
jgi:hypothetical protein